MYVDDYDYLLATWIYYCFFALLDSYYKISEGGALLFPCELPIDLSNKQIIKTPKPADLNATLINNII
jgi:hypothetical protein